MRTEIFEETCAERARLVALLEQLDPAGWGAATLCAGRRVTRSSHT